MPSALLFVILGVMWAVVLVPMWLRKHDEANESRSVDRFSRALNSLSARLDKDARTADGNDTVVVERGAVPARREVLMPGRPRGAQDVQVTVSGPRAAASAARSTPASRPATSRRPVTPAMRRRRLVLGLLVLTVLAVVGGLQHLVPVWVGAVPAVLALLLLVGGRRQARRRAEIARRRARRETLSAAARAAERAQAAEARRGRRVVADVVAHEVHEVHEEAAPEPAADAYPAEHWHAVPTTLPTYVTAPPATRVPRVIDRTTPGGLSGAAMVEQARRTRQVEPADESGMRVESFEISVPRGPSAAQLFAEQYVDPRAGSAELAAMDDEAAIAALVDDPRTGVDGRGYRRAAG